jgi:hypothetical protein
MRGNFSVERLKQDEESAVVSVWLGVFASEREFDAYMEEQYEEDDRPLSPFAADFRFGWYDHDFLEAEWHPELIPALELLKGFSFGSSFVPEVAAEANRQGMAAANTAIILYHYTYTPDPDRVDAWVRFIGTFGFSKQAAPD